jgi:hypothetical protein
MQRVAPEDLLSTPMVDATSIQVAIVLIRRSRRFCGNWPVAHGPNFSVKRIATEWRCLRPKIVLALKTGLAPQRRFQTQPQPGAKVIISTRTYPLQRLAKRMPDRIRLPCNASLLHKPPQATVESGVKFKFNCLIHVIIQLRVVSGTSGWAEMRGIKHEPH